MENRVREKSNLRVGFLQLLCLVNLYNEETATEDEKVKTIDEKKLLVMIKLIFFPK